VANRETVISIFKLGNTVILNLDAQTNQYLDEVSIGMHTLKYFLITQDGKTLTLIAQNQLRYLALNLPAAQSKYSEQELLRNKSAKICKQLRVLHTKCAGHV
jgi:hypothetical protein